MSKQINQIKLSEIKAIMGMAGWSNNSFANALCCLMADSVDADMRKAEEYASEGHEDTAQLFTNCAENTRERKNLLHDKLASLGLYDDIRKKED